MSKSETRVREQSKKAGRPPKEFTVKQLRQIDRLAFRQCKDTTIAEALGIDAETFRAHFQARTRQKRAQGKLLLHCTQWQMARKNTGMAIWLGKQYLEQSEKADLSGDLTVGIINYAAAKNRKG